MTKFLLAVALTSWSAYATLTTSAYCRAGNFQYGDSIEQSDSGTMLSQCEASSVGVMGGEIYSQFVSTEVTAAYGDLLVNGQNGWQILGPDDGTAPYYPTGVDTLEQRGFASFEDILTIFDAPQGSVLLAYATGTPIYLATASRSATVTVGSVGASVLEGANPYAILTVPFSNGVPMSVKAAVQASGSNFGGFAFYPYQQLTLEFLLVPDLGRPFEFPVDFQYAISNYRFRTASGAKYGLTGTFAAIPEPGTAWLLPVGLATGLLVARRRPYRFRSWHGRGSLLPVCSRTDVCEVRG